MDLDNPGECRQWADLYERTAKERDEYRRELISLRLSHSTLAAENEKLKADLKREEDWGSEAIEERDARIEQINDIADALGDEGEWSNLHDRGDTSLFLARNAVAEVDSLRAQRDAALAEVAKMRAERDEAQAKFEALDHDSAASFCGMVKLRDDAVAERDAYRSMVCDLLASAHPHPTEHPTMTAQWAKARALLKNGPTTPSKPADKP